MVCRRALVLEESLLFEGKELVVRDDDVVEDLDAKDFARLVQAAGEFDVVLTRGRVA